MRPPKNAWPNDDVGETTPFLAQSVSEMLEAATYESFRAPTLESVARLGEAGLLVGEVLRDRVPKRVLEPVWDELKVTLNADEIAKKVASAEIELLSSTKWNDKSPTELFYILSYVRRNIAELYQLTCETEIQILLRNSKEKLLLRRLIGYYLSYLINHGYHPSFISKICDSVFFSSDITEAGELTSQFFAEFSGKKKRFRVYARINAEFTKFIKLLDRFKVLQPTRKPSGIPATVARSLPLSNGEAYFVYDCESLDEITALELTAETLSSIQALAFLDPSPLNYKWDNSMVVKRAADRKGTLLNSQAMPLQRKAQNRKISTGAIKSASTYSDRMLTNFDSPSLERILNSLSMSALARTSSSPKTQLISLWSAIEVLLTEPSPEAASRISHYTELLVPCVCLRYVKQMVVSVFDELNRIYPGRFTKIVSSYGSRAEMNQHFKFACILFLPRQNAHVDALMELCERNPLARHRLWKLNRDFADSNRLMKSLNEHRRRVEWQIFRIYRARNAITHAGTQPEYIDSLILNLDDYFRSTLGSLMSVARKEKNESDLDSVIADIRIRYSIYLQQLRKLDGIASEEDVRKIYL